MFCTKLPVKSTVPGSTGCQHVRSNATTRRIASNAFTANLAQSSPLSASPAISPRARLTTSRRMALTHMIEPLGSGPPLHVHHNADETFYVIDGELIFFVGDERIEAGPGDFVFGPQGLPHAYVARSEEAEFVATFAPASMDRFFEEAGASESCRASPRPRPPSPTRRSSRARSPGGASRSSVRRLASTESERRLVHDASTGDARRAAAKELRALAAAR